MVITRAERRPPGILYVEDEPETRHYVAEVLAEQFPALRLDVAADGAEGLVLFKEHRPQVVVTDITMPVMDGLAMARQMRELDAEVELIALTSYSETSFMVKAIELGFSNYLFKPINLKKLVLAVRKTIEVSELKHKVAEQNRQLRESEQRLQATFDQAAVGIGHVALDGTFLRLNEKYCDITGSTSEAPPMTIYDFTHPDDFHRCRQHHERLLEGRTRSYSLEKRYVHDGTVVWATLTASLVKDAEGNAIFMVVIVDDITERKELEARIVDLNAALEARATELESANSDLKAFNYTIAHDLRQPLNMISGYCQAIKMMCGEELSGDCHDFLDKAYEGTVRMNQLVSALLQFAEMAHAEPKQEPVDLSTAAEEIAAELQRGEPERRARFIIAQGMKVEGDPQLLGAVLANLIGNAWKYTSERGETLIEFGAVVEQGEQVFFVRDNGIGFSEEEAGDIFLPFRRLAAGRHMGGFGIGLATVERIVKRHGGRIWAQGEPGQGATFYFTLK